MHCNFPVATFRMGSRACRAALRFANWKCPSPSGCCKEITYLGVPSSLSPSSLTDDSSDMASQVRFSFW